MQLEYKHATIIWNLVERRFEAVLNPELKTWLDERQISYKLENALGEPYVDNPELTLFYKEDELLFKLTWG
jgi:hypothetical protein